MNRRKNMKRNFVSLCLCFLAVYGMAGKIIKNPMDPVRSVVIGLEKVRTFSPDNPAKDIFLNTPMSAVEGLNGQIYVADGQSGLIHQYDSTGHYLRHFCGKGQGPDEVNFPGAFLADSDGQVLVLDPFSARIVIFSPKGTLGKNVRSGNKFEFANGLLQVSGGWVISVPRNDKKGQYKRDVVVHLGKAFNEIREICPLSEWKSVHAATVNFDNAYARFTAARDRIYVSRGSRTDIVIQVLNLRGQKVRTIMRDYRSVRRSDDEIKRLNYFGKRLQEGCPELNLAPASPYRVSVMGMFVDGKGRLWVKTAREAGDNESKWDYSIFDKSGTLIGRIPALKGKVTVRGNRLCQLYEDKKTDEFRVAVYKIVEENGGEK